MFKTGTAWREKAIREEFREYGLTEQFISRLCSLSWNFWVRTKIERDFKRVRRRDKNWKAFRKMQWKCT